MDYERLDHNLTTHAPVNPSMAATTSSLIRAYARTLGANVIRLCPEGREKALALTKLEETVMWAIAAIARDQPA